MKIKLNQLVYGVNRPQSWIDERPQFKAMQDLLKDSLTSDGQKAPLVVKETEDGKWLVVKGNQRLMAMLVLGWKEVECVHVDRVSKRMLKSDPEWDPDIKFKHLIPEPKQTLSAAEEQLKEQRIQRREQARK